jgi:arylsulfatase A-like enzyme
MNMELPEPIVGEWAKVFDAPVRGLPVDSWRMSVDKAVMKQYRAAYYGCINHIDDQIGRLLSALPADTIILFCSDHGEMLGDHQWIRKMNAFEASARIPFLLKFPKEMGIPQAIVREEVVELMDVMPTLLDAAGVPIPDSVDGSSVLPLLRGESRWREYIHGECASIPTLGSGMQYVTDGKRKFIYYPGTGQEQYFNLQQDPREMTELSTDPNCAAEIAVWRSRLRQLH